MQTIFVLIKCELGKAYEVANEIADAKREVIDQARALVDARLPARQRADQAKALQQRWRELGRAPKGEPWKTQNGYSVATAAQLQPLRNHSKAQTLHWMPVSRPGNFWKNWRASVRC